MFYGPNPGRCPGLSHGAPLGLGRRDSSRGLSPLGLGRRGSSRGVSLLGLGRRGSSRGLSPLGLGRQGSFTASARWGWEGVVRLAASLRWTRGPPPRWHFFQAHSQGGGGVKFFPCWRAEWERHFRTRTTARWMVTACSRVEGVGDEPVSGRARSALARLNPDGLALGRRRQNPLGEPPTDGRHPRNDRLQRSGSAEIPPRRQRLRCDAGHR